MDEPLSNQEAQKLVREILNSGTVFFTPHAQKAMADDDLTTVDVENVLRAGGSKCPSTRIANGDTGFEPIASQ
jgi:hypothetical protein